MRDHLGIRAFGINSWRADEAVSDVISEHTEGLSGHEELYLVLSGQATFTIDGEEVEAPAGTLVHVADPALRRRAVAAAPGTEVLAIGAKPGVPFEVSSWEVGWEIARRAMDLYREQRYPEAVDVLRAGILEHPDHPGFHYNLACFESLAGEPLEIVVVHLRRAIELYPEFRELAAGDADFAPVRETEEFASAVAGQAHAGRGGS